MPRRVQATARLCSTLLAAVQRMQRQMDPHNARPQSVWEVTARRLAQGQQQKGPPMGVGSDEGEWLQGARLVERLWKLFSDADVDGSGSLEAPNLGSAAPVWCVC